MAADVTQYAVRDCTGCGVVVLWFCEPGLAWVRPGSLWPRE